MSQTAVADTPVGAPLDPAEDASGDGGGFIVIELGNPAPVENVSTVGPNGELTSELRPLERTGNSPVVTRVTVPMGLRDDGLPIYSVGHDVPRLPAELQSTLDTVDGLNLALRRIVIDRWLAQGRATYNVKGLPDHEVLAAVIDPQGVWANHSAAESATWVQARGGAPGEAEYVEQMLALYFDCPIGAPGDVEDTHWTRHGNTSYPPGAKPDPLSGIQALHTSWGRDFQALVMGGLLGYLGTKGTATASAATTLTGSTESGISHAADDCKGQILAVGPNASGTGSTVYGLIKSNTSGTTPVYTVDRWYDPANPGGAAGTTPNATSFYQVVNAGPSSMYVGLSTDTTAKSLGGTNGTADANAIGTAMTGEIATAGGGLIRKIGVLAHSAGASTWTNTPVFTANGSDSLSVTIGTATSSPSIVAQAVTYMTLVSPTATLSASGDQLTLTWTFTMT